MNLKDCFESCVEVIGLSFCRIVYCHFMLSPFDEQHWCTVKSISRDLHQSNDYAKSKKERKSEH